MPAWGMHIAIAKLINNKLKNKLDMNSYIIGNVIADAEKWVIEDLSYYILYKESHYAKSYDKKDLEKILPDTSIFLDKYRDSITNPFILGYYTHLLTDYFWNKTINSNFLIYNKEQQYIGILLNDNKILKENKNHITPIKQHDFHLFSIYLNNINLIDIPVYTTNIDNDIRKFTDFNVKHQDIEKIINYINNFVNSTKKLNFNFNNIEYKLFTQKCLDNYLNSCIEFILKKYKDLDIV